MKQSLTVVGYAALAAALTLILSGCVYDYKQHTDRVSYSAGDAVKANLEGQTVNPSKSSMYNTTGLGKNGAVIVVVPEDSAQAAE